MNLINWKLISLSALAATTSLLIAGCNGHDSESAHEHGVQHSNGHMREGGHMDGADPMQRDSETDSGEHAHQSEMAYQNSGHRDQEMVPHGTSEAQGPDGARRIEITATDYAFAPADVKAEPGERLYIAVENAGKTVHMWQLRNHPETHVHVEPGERSGRVIVAPQSPGEYEIFCGTPEHADRGMVGTLIVENG
ncbi:cupredoxin domain-containing protein [Pelagicoccus sp. SDUM812003]|uniref:cupredoxin domain-containing protein n=1 Tax=Pelagicoccus sp. SDUM812003 TaxID=3041267 RepID=UPI00281081F5|nr:cupredoxin domain-containing protein [Pelagicoccus sp. SDUM812003]MDQ8204746.1 cupredoxin domain-containing protein [Pelagicoccus sp. SDUM812003]